MTPEPPAAGAEHNPDNLTREQLGEGWRFLLRGDRLDHGDEVWLDGRWRRMELGDGTCLHDLRRTYRRRIYSDEQSAKKPAMLHNPDGLTFEQVGDGWRLLFQDETVTADDEFHAQGYGWREVYHSKGQPAGRCEFTFRRKASPADPVVPPSDTQVAYDLTGACKRVYDALTGLPADLRKRAVEAALTLLGEK